MRSMGFAASGMSSEDLADWSTETPIDYAEGSENYIADFLSRRDLVNLTETDEAQRRKHEMKYKKELDLDEESTKRGNPKYKKYREENCNEHSKCDAQFINNLHTFYGDGSRLQKTPKPHYAVDFVRINGVESEETSALKSLKVSRRKVTPPWLASAFRCSVRPHLSRRSRSCIPFHVESKTSINPPKNPRRDWNYKSSVHNVDESFQLPNECLSYNCRASLLYEEVAQTLSRMISYVNAMDLRRGVIKVSKVLFSTDDLYAYVIPADVPISLQTFSEAFSKWYITNKQRLSRGSELQRRKPDFWNKINVVLYLPEFEKEGTMYRRARHIYKLWPSGRAEINQQDCVSIDLYVELDTGMLRVHRSSHKTVAVLCQTWALVPPAIIEVRFKHAKDQKDVAEEIEKIRKSGQAYIDSFDIGDRQRNQTMHYRGDQSNWNWTNIETAVLAPFARYEKPGLATMFCGDKDCMGMCCTDTFYQRGPFSPPPAPAPVCVNPVMSQFAYREEVLDVTRESVPQESIRSQTYFLSPGSENDSFFARA